MQERWSGISEFPDYKVSNYGEIKNQNTGRTLKTSVTKAGVVKIGFFVDGERYTRSVCILVAEPFVFGKTDIFNTPMHLDGNSLNNRADNLMWRPRWFAMRYCKQFGPNIFHDRGPVYELTEGVVYNTVLEAAVENGFLITGQYSIMESVRTGETVWPTRKIFAFRK